MEKDGSKQGLKKGTWKPEEDLLLTRYIETYGEGNWATVSKRSGLLRGGKSCRLRWKNYLRPNLKRGEMSEEEEDLIIRMHKLVGNRWSLIAGRLPGRTDNAVKNYWNTHLIKKIVVDKVVAAATRKTKRANTCTSFSENTSKKGSEISMKVEEEIRQELVKGDEDHPQNEPYALTNDMVPVNHETMSWQPGGESPYYEDPFLSSLQSINLLESFRDSMESTIGPWTFLPKDMYSPFF